ncbi:MAG TPA: hypothetical protein VGB70_12770 [Allosphingosinicella sp.]|jgi:hypothetical protein
MSAVGKIVSNAFTGFFTGGPLGAIAGAGAGLIGAVSGKKGKGSKQAGPSILMPRGITRNDAVDARMRDDERRKRRGVGANILTGGSGAEARTPGGKVLLGQ